MPLALVSHQFTSKIHFKIVVRTVEARFTIMFIIAEILKINVRCCSSITNYARVRTLCSRCEFFARSRRASVVISCLREISTWTFNMKKKVPPLGWGNLCFRDPNSQQVQYFHYPPHPHGKFVNTSEGTMPINSMNVWSWLCQSRESKIMKPDEFMSMNLQIVKS